MTDDEINNKIMLMGIDFHKIIIYLKVFVYI